MTLDSSLLQPSLPGLCLVERAIAAMSESSAEERGAVFTKPEVVEFILDLIGYTTDKPLFDYKILEPSVGQGDFLLPTLDRLLTSYGRLRGQERRDVVADLTDSLRAVELHWSSYEATKKLIKRRLRREGIAEEDAKRLVECWLHHGDFLLHPFHGQFTHVVGNPPYVRQELIPDALIAEYRKRFTTIFDRADLYVPFFERSLLLLAPGGQLGFICSDRWMKNRYGGPLRGLVAERFHLKCYVDMFDTAAFQTDVIAYPAIVVISREKASSTRVARRPEIGRDALKAVANALTTRKRPTKSSGVSEISGVAQGTKPWALEDGDGLDLIRRLESSLPTLEEAGCKVGIGVATGADRIFIGPFDELDVESDRKLPLAMTRDLLTGSVVWRGLGVINPFAEDGRLVDLRMYPRLARYLERHSSVIKARHTAKKNPGSWYRTIDRIYPKLKATPKLLIPDIKGEAQVVFDEGHLYPHHNLYFVTSECWDLRALQAVLSSDVTRLFISLYSVKMRGGYLRFQAQYLRRIRLPHWKDVTPRVRKLLKSAALAQDRAECNAAVADLFGLNAAERAVLCFSEETRDVA